MAPTTSHSCAIIAFWGWISILFLSVSWFGFPLKALRKSGPLEGKLLQSSIRAYQGPPAAEKPSGAPPAATPPARNTGRLGLSDREADDALNDIDLAMVRMPSIILGTLGALLF